MCDGLSYHFPNVNVYWFYHEHFSGVPVDCFSWMCLNLMFGYARLWYWAPRRGPIISKNVQSNFFSRTFNIHTASHWTSFVSCRIKEYHRIGRTQMWKEEHIRSILSTYLRYETYLRIVGEINNMLSTMLQPQFH